LFCPIEKFSELVADVLPEDEASLCGSMMKIIDEKNTESGGVNVLISEMLLVIFSLISGHTIKNILSM
jgi:hypothetical protein